jgi:release factor glutamine methyltransferase
VALTGGPTGCEIYQRLIGEAARVLRPGGHLAVELGFRTVDRVREMAAAHFTGIRLIDDLAGIPRVLCCKLR